MYTKFLLDSTVERLCRWLRLLGFDAQLSREANDVSFLVGAKNEGRIALTRKRSRVKNKRDAILLESENIRAQVKEIVKRFGLPDRPLSRCSLCNTLLVEKGKKDVFGNVPEHVYKTSKEFFACPFCEKIYWSGTHPARMKKFLEGALGT